MTRDNINYGSRQNPGTNNNANNSREYKAANDGNNVGWTKVKCRYTGHYDYKFNDSTIKLIEVWNEGLDGRPFGVFITFNDKDNTNQIAKKLQNFGFNVVDQNPFCEIDKIENLKCMGKIACEINYFCNRKEMLEIDKLRNMPKERSIDTFLKLAGVPEDAAVDICKYLGVNIPHFELVKVPTLKELCLQQIMVDQASLEEVSNNHKKLPEDLKAEIVGRFVNRHKKEESKGGAKGEVKGGR